MSGRITVSLTKRAGEALDHLVAETGDSKTDLINRAVQLYHFVHGVEALNAEVLVRYQDGDTERVRFL